MGYFKTIEEMAAEAKRWDSLSPEERKKETETNRLREIEIQKEQRRAEEEAARLRQEALTDVKSRAAMFREMIDNAYADKDTLRYVYGVAALVIINNLENGIEGMATEDIKSLVPDSIPDTIGIEELEYLKQICPRFGGHSHVDPPIHEDVDIRNYSICDLVSTAIRALKCPSAQTFNLF